MMSVELNISLAGNMGMEGDIEREYTVEHLLSEGQFLMSQPYFDSQFCLMSQLGYPMVPQMVAMSLNPYQLSLFPVYINSACNAAAF
jgi:hypothetical protein